MYETIELIMFGLMILIFGVACFASGYISHWKKISHLLPFSEIGKAISVMIGVGVSLNFDLNMFFQDKADRGLENIRKGTGFAQPLHTRTKNSNPPANNESDVK